MSSHNAMSPNGREAIGAVSTISGKFEYLKTTSGVLQTSATIGGSAIPIAGATTGVGVAILDGSGNQITSFGGGTQYAELVTTAPGTGTLSLGRYKLAAPTLTDGQMYGLQLDSSGNLKVTGSLSVGGTTDNSAYTAGSSTGTPSYGFYHSTIDTVTDGRTAALGMTNKRAMFTNLQSSAGTELLGQKTMAGSVPIVIASDQSALSVSATQSGSWNATTFPQIFNGATFESMTGAGARGTDMNIKAINAVTPLMGNGVTGTGSQRVTIASDNTAFSVNATLSAETTKVIGTARILDSLGNATNSAATGFLKVTDEPRQVFYDPFDATPDTTNMWTSTTGSSGVAASVATGVLSMGTGTVANGYSKFTSIPTFKPVIPGWVVFSDAILIPDAAAPVANALRLWGTGTTPGTPTFAAPITDGYFFELSGSTLSAVVYAGGVRTQIATGLTLSTTTQRYIIQVRTDRTFFYIGTIDSAGLVATTNFQSPQIQTLPKTFLAVGNSTPPVSNSQIQCTGAVVSDTGKNSTLIADGTFPWRRQTVKGASTAAASTDLPAVVALHPTSPLPAGTNALGSLTAGSAIIGKVGIDQTTPGTTNLVALAANQSVNVAQINGITPLMGNGVTGTGSQRVTIASDNTAFSVNATLAAGSALAGKVGIDQTTPGTTNAVVDTPTTAGGLLIVTGSVGATATAIKASAGQLYGYHLFNTTAAVAYVQIFNVAVGSVTLGTTAPTFSIGIPASGGVTINFDKGIAFGTAITFACTTTRTGLTGATCDVNFFYK